MLIIAHNNIFSDVFAAVLKVNQVENSPPSLKNDPPPINLFWHDSYSQHKSEEIGKIGAQGFI